MTDDGLGTYIVVWTEQCSSRYEIHASHWSTLDAAFGQWVERGIDKLLELNIITGPTLMLPVSRISEFLLSTPDSRAVQRVRNVVEKQDAGE